MTALKITYDNTSGLTAETVQAALDELVVNLGSTDSAILALSGRLNTLEGTGAGSVSKAINDALEPIEEDIADHEERIAQNESDIRTLEGVVDNNRLYSDSQYLALKAKADSLQVKCNTLQAEVYTDDPILQYGAVEIIGDGYEADDTPIDVSANVVDGKLDMEQKGLTIRNIVDGADIADDSTVTFATILNDKYYDTLNNAILTGTGSDMTATNESGATANMGIYHLNALGLSTITDTAILAKLLPYVDGTKNVGKMGILVRGVNLFDKNNATILGLAYNADASPRSYLYDKSTGTITVSGIPAFRGVGVKFSCKEGDSITVSWEVVIPPTSQRNAIQWYNVDGVKIGDTPDSTPNRISGIAPVGSSYGVGGMMSYTSGELYSYTDIQVSYGSSAIPYEPYQEQLTFLPTIGNSLPNGIADSIKTVADGWEHSKRVSTLASVSSGVAVNTTNYPTAKNGGQWVNELTAGGTEIGVVGTDSTTGAGMLRFELATPIITHYDLPLPTSGKTIHRFAGEEKIALYGTGLTFDENVLSVISAFKFVAGVMTDITSLATITGATVTFSGVSATDVVYVKVEHDVDRPLGILEHTPAVSNTASRLAALEAAVFGG